MRLLCGTSITTFFFWSNLYQWFICIYICAPHAYLVLVETRRGRKMLQNYNYRLATMLVTGIHPETSGRADSILNL